MAVSKAQINKIADFDLRTTLLGIYDEVDSLHQATGTAFLSPVNNTQKPASAAPAAPGISVAGSNGVFVASITPPPQSINKQLWYELSYSPQSNFTQGVTTMEPSAATSVVIPAPGVSACFRVRASYDQSNWSSYAYAT